MPEVRRALACLDEFGLDPWVDVSSIRPGVVFVPFHHGYWDTDAEEPNGRARAANELTLTASAPVDAG
jgi:hypothetical protein